MDKELIIRKLKENTKVIALGFVILMSAIIIGVSISTLSKTDNTLYQESKDGIYIEEEYLKTNESISVKVYMKSNDTIHCCWKTWDDSFSVWVYFRAEFWGEGGYGNKHYDRSYWNVKDSLAGTVFIELINKGLSGFIEVFVIVWSENDYPYCPLCN